MLEGTTSGCSTTFTIESGDNFKVEPCATETHCGCEYHHNDEYHSGREYHCGDEIHCGYVRFSCGCEFHCGYEYHCGTESHCGTEYHCGTETHNGWVSFSGACGCATDGFTGTNIRVSGIAVVDPANSSNKVLLTYNELKSHGF